MRKLCDPAYHSGNSIIIASIKLLIQQFVRQFGTIYGIDHITYVVHIFLHLCDDVLLYGSPQKFDAYKYENNNNKIVKNIRHGLNVPQQIHKRAIEKLAILSIKNMKSLSPTLLRKCVTNKEKKVIFKKLVFNNLVFDNTGRNKYIYTKKNLICCFVFAEVGENNRIFITCEKICGEDKLESFIYCKNFNSAEVDTFIVKPSCEEEIDDEMINNDTITIGVDDIKNKMFAIPITEGIILIKIINDNDD